MDIRLLRHLSLVAVPILLAAACNNGDPEVAPEADEADVPEEEVEEVTTVEMVLTPSQVAVAIAEEEGLFEGVSVDYTLMGYGEVEAAYIARDLNVGYRSPHETAERLAMGEDIVWLSTAGALNMWNGIVIRTDDADQYQEIADLAGTRLGSPGFGSGTWLAFAGLASQQGLNPHEDFEVIVADAGALLGLLEEGRIDATLTFTGQTGASMALDQFEVMTAFTEEWEEETGHPLVVTGLMGKRSWVEDNIDATRRLIEGIDRGVEWMKDNPDEFTESGQYASWVEGEGWLLDEETNRTIVEILVDGRWYLTSDLYTSEWIDSSYQFIESLGDEIEEELPPQEELFFSPEKLQ